MRSERNQVVLDRLRKGPATTLDLQALGTIVHAPKQIHDLRLDGWVIARTSLPNRVALYRLIGHVSDAPVETPAIPPVGVSTRTPRPPVEFGNPASVLAYGRGRR